MPDEGEDNGGWDEWSDGENSYKEVTTDDFGTHGSQVFFKYSDWQYKISPRL